MIICKYLGQSHKPAYERSGLNTYQFLSLFQLFKLVFVLILQKKNKSLGNRDDRADQVARRNDHNMLGILRANLKLKHMFIIQGRREKGTGEEGGGKTEKHQIFTCE